MTLEYELLKELTVKEFAQRMLAKAYEEMEANRTNPEMFRAYEGRYYAYKDIVQFILKKEEVEFIERGGK